MKEENTTKNISDKNKEDLTQELESNTPPKPLSKNSDLEKRIHSLEQSLEQRVSLETLFSQRFSELRGELRREVDSRFRKYGMVAFLVVSVLSFFGYQIIRDSVTRQVDKQFTVPELKKAVDIAIEKKAESFVATKIKPLEERVERLNKDIQAKQNELATAQTHLGQILEIQQLSIGARAGSRADYEKLLELSKSEEDNIRKSAEAAVRDLEYYFSADRYQLTGYNILADKTGREISFSVEELATELRNKNTGMREAAINVIANTKNKHFIEDLVSALSKEPNLRICARITRALENITDEHFNPLAFDAVSSWWEQNKNNQDYLSPFHHYFDGVAAIKAGNPDEALTHFDRMIEKEPQALQSMFYKAQILTQKGKYDEAEKTLKKVEEINNNFRWLYVGRAYLFIKQGKQDDAVININRAIEISPGIEEYIRLRTWAKPLLNNDAIKWPSQSVTTKKNEIKQDRISE